MVVVVVEEKEVGSEDYGGGREGWGGGGIGVVGKRSSENPFQDSSELLNFFQLFV